MLSILLIAFVVMLLLGVPISIAMGASSVLAIVSAQTVSPEIIAQGIFKGLDSFPLIAIPFFLFAAEILTGARISDLLFKVALGYVGRLKGGLGYANIASVTAFSGISGSAIADVAGPGAIAIRMMHRNGYPLPYSAALTAVASIVGPLVPPSIIMILYALVDNSISVGTLFVAGIGPAVLVVIGMLLVHAFYSRRLSVDADARPPRAGELARLTARTLPALALPVFVVVGIHGGYVTASEASVVAVTYALVLGFFVYRTLSLRDLFPIALQAALASCAVLFLLATSSLFAWLLTIEQVPMVMRGLLSGVGPIAFLLMVNILLLLVGTALEPAPAILICVPILAPMAHALGIPPAQFAVIVILNLTLGMLTPPVGSLLFVASTVSRVDLNTLTRASLPMFAVQLGVLALVTAVPAVSTGLVTWLR
ncbi:MAG TPA: TRAP transporter large permease [Burkholderiaceae bacterium]|nr:TRAP transporter large permease [Burkholderiaceae bacterium]